MIIFDFDQTLVDTQPVEHLRSAGNWKGVMARVAQLEVYDGINALLGSLKERGHKLAIVTKSPDMVPKAFIRQYDWPVDIVVGYHQVTQRKPHPAGLLLAMKLAAAEPGQSFHVGDQAQDTEASRAAGVIAIGSGWGIADVAELKASRPDHLFMSVSELAAYLSSVPRALA